MFLRRLKSNVNKNMEMNINCNRKESKAVVMNRIGQSREAENSAIASMENNSAKRLCQALKLFL